MLILSAAVPALIVTIFVYKKKNAQACARFVEAGMKYENWKKEKESTLPVLQRKLEWLESTDAQNRYYHQQDTEDDEKDPISNYGTVDEREENLYLYVLSQLEVMDLEPELLPVGRFLVESLNQNGWLDEQGRVYIIYTVREVQESLCCAEHKAVKLFRELEQIDLIERKRRGLGRPSLIYVKDFTTGLSKTHNLNCANNNSGVVQSAAQEPPKPQANKTDKNNTEMNKPDPIHSEDIREQLEDYFYQVLEVELLLRLFPDDEDTIYQIVDLLVDTCATKRRMVRIAGDDKPAEVVRSRLKKLNADHIRFVLDSLAENTAPVRNMKQYLLAMLYNAPTTMNLYYQNKTNYDFARGSPKAG